jgi:RecG-like helicase
VNNDGKIISDKNDYRRNELVIKKIKEKYKLSFSEGKQNVKRERLKEPDKTKYQLYDAIKSTMNQSCSWSDFKNKLESNHKIDYKLIVKTNTRQVQGIIFQKGQYQFKGSEIDRSLSFSKINAFFEEQKQFSQNSNIGNSNKANNPELIKEAPIETGAIKQEAIESALNTALGLFTPESHGPDPLEDEFRRRMQKKMKRGFGCSAM